MLVSDSAVVSLIDIHGLMSFVMRSDCLSVIDRRLTDRRQAVSRIDALLLQSRVGVVGVVLMHSVAVCRRIPVLHGQLLSVHLLIVVVA